MSNHTGRARRSGKRFTARFAHVWTLHDGLIVRLQQCADTVQLARALAVEPETTA
jgi:ketosteroid isomerase-like protein